MYCKHCGAKITKDEKFCNSCGTKIESSVSGSEIIVADHKLEVNKIENKPEIKNYSPVFWKYFWIGALLNIFSRFVEASGTSSLSIILIILVIAYIYKFSETINNAMLSIGKKNWWPLGLLSLIPLGFWFAFLIVRSALKPRGKWVSEHKSFKLSKKI